MTFAVHVKHGIGLGRIRSKTQVGLEPKYQTSFKAVDQQDKTRYNKNYMLLTGKCRKCENFLMSQRHKTDGSHCFLERCVKWIIYRILLARKNAITLRHFHWLSIASKGGIVNIVKYVIKSIWWIRWFRWLFIHKTWIWMYLTWAEITAKRNLYRNSKKNGRTPFFSWP